MLDDHNVFGDILEAGSLRRAFSDVSAMEYNLCAIIRQLTDCLAGPMRGAVGDDNDLLLDAHRLYLSSPVPTKG
jgi:hypothetical protein